MRRYQFTKYPNLFRHTEWGQFFQWAYLDVFPNDLVLNNHNQFVEDFNIIRIEDKNMLKANPDLSERIAKFQQLHKYLPNGVNDKCNIYLDKDLNYVLVVNDKSDEYEKLGFTLSYKLGFNDDTTRILVVKRTHNIYTEFIRDNIKDYNRSIYQSVTGKHVGKPEYFKITKIHEKFKEWKLKHNRTEKTTMKALKSSIAEFFDSNSWIEFI
jgi:hypothetical protein